MHIVDEFANGSAKDTAFFGTKRVQVGSGEGSDVGCAFCLLSFAGTDELAETESASEMLIPIATMLEVI